jgi:peptidyl-prolyl cis-trans isomerase D
MITWMQRHKKYLIITIWISTIAFVGAGFVGWGQYQYGNKAGAVAKVGNVELTRGELQKEYSKLYAQYNQMFQGNFDEEKAKNFGLQSQAMKQLTDRALLLNLAHSYDLSITDAELLAELTTQEYFFKDSKFDKDTYKQVLSRNRLTTTEYESDLKKQLLIQKMLKLLKVEESPNEAKILNTMISIADKLSYKVIDDSSIKSIDTSDQYLKPYWEARKDNFMSDVSYDVKYIKQEKVSQTYDDKKISAHYNDNKTHFKAEDGKLLPLEKAKSKVIAELNSKATKNKALRSYIAYKKGKLDASIKPTTATVSKTSNIFDAQTLEKLSKLSLTSPFLKPQLVNGEYFIIELIKTNPSEPKSFQEAKEEVKALFIAETKRATLLKLAEHNLKNFKGKTTEFITLDDAKKLSELDSVSANEFLTQLFNSQQKRGFIPLQNGKIVLYNVMEQKLLSNSDSKDNSIVGLKSSMFNEGLIKNLNNIYHTEIFIEGL